MWSTPWIEWRKCTSYTNRIVGGSHRIGTNIRCAWCCNKWIPEKRKKTKSQRNRVKRVKWAKGSYIRLRWFGTQFWKVNKENTIKPDLIWSQVFKIDGTVFIPAFSHDPYLKRYDFEKEDELWKAWMTSKASLLLSLSRILSSLDWIINWCRASILALDFEMNLKPCSMM